MESLEIRLARMEEKLDVMIQRLTAGDEKFAKFDTRIRDLETQVNQVRGGLIIVSVLIPVIVKYIL